MKEEIAKFDGEDEVTSCVVETNKYGTVRVDGETDFEWAKSYIKEFGEKSYVDFLIEYNTPNPKGIKIKDAELAQELVDAGLQE